MATSGEVAANIGNTGTPGRNPISARAVVPPVMAEACRPRGGLRPEHRSPAQGGRGDPGRFGRSVGDEAGERSLAKVAQQQTADELPLVSSDGATQVAQP